MISGIYRHCDNSIRFVIVPKKKKEKQSVEYNNQRASDASDDRNWRRYHFGCEYNSRRWRESVLESINLTCSSVSRRKGKRNEDDDRVSRGPNRLSWPALNSPRRPAAHSSPPVCERSLHPPGGGERAIPQHARIFRRATCLVVRASANALR